MKVTYRWLKDLLDITANPDEVAKKLTAVGLEVASVNNISIPKGIVVAKVVEKEKHPNADKLSICKVDIGADKTLNIVCGAPNVTVGMIVPCATIGTQLAPEFVIKKTKLRGEISEGMLCSEQELGVSDENDGLMKLSEKFIVGKPISEYYNDDAIIEIELTPNRGDCLGVLGVARDLAAIYRIPLKSFTKTPTETGLSITDCDISVTIDNSDRCPRYMGRLVRNIVVKESPDWMKMRLRALGVRSINNIVDITNYIMLLFGQPMHAFDYNTIAEKRIIVKCAVEGEKFITLDDVERTLTSEDLLICDAEHPVAIAGVMGGSNSGIKNTTTDVFLECAFFDPVGVRRTAKRLDLSTDSSYRFERGVDPADGLSQALDMAATLVAELADGNVAKEIVDIYPSPFVKKIIPLRPSFVARVLGVKIPKDEIVTSLEFLGLCCTKNDGDNLVFEAPLFRHDLDQEIDLVEEVGRLYGYDNIPTKPQATIEINQLPNNADSIKNKIRQILAGAGLHECVTNSMISERRCDELAPNIKPVAIMNPLTPDMSCMRPTLLGAMLNVVSRNNNRKSTDCHLFEIGRNFRRADNNAKYVEDTVLAILIEGNFIKKSWNSETESLTFYHLKAFVENLAISLGNFTFSFSRIEQNRATYFTSESGSFTHKLMSGALGKVNKSIAKSFGVTTPVYFAEIFLGNLLEHGIPDPTYRELPKFPTIERDFAFVMDEPVLAKSICDEIFSLSDLVESVVPFDLYKGEHLESGKKSIAFSVTLRHKNRTLTEKDASFVCTSVIESVQKKFNAVLR